ncbi:MAG: ABC transporter ATP-binding protein [Candidatus Abyssobacteria bacterium SURF_17]|uniref:ABC transporter ATP-binding protein n=1 Tax=Candidatus Abyssobacteria bacterium SURF_17 TaxID=2093361 RepID=A0A419F6T5_9BACT|nr:MAG: ABC transporter ATP-binding protein [Candidatus Abyssubacteria bacterium SURF_17]
MLKVQNLKSYYGRLQALRGISLHVGKGEIVTLIGANGAGKSTILNTVAGLVSQNEGKILLEGKDIRGLAPERIVRHGVALVPEGRQLFAPMTVVDNLELGAYVRHKNGSKIEIRQDMEMVFDLFPVLKERRKQLAGTLSGGEQQMLAIARALMSRPRLLLLDEPSMGLAPKISEEIFRTIVRLKKQEVTILLVEQNARMALEVAGRGYVIETGQVVVQGPSADLLRNHEVERAYLGKTYEKVWE